MNYFNPNLFSILIVSMTFRPFIVFAVVTNFLWKQNAPSVSKWKYHNFYNSVMSVILGVGNSLSTPGPVGKAMCMRHACLVHMSRESLRTDCNYDLYQEGNMLLSKIYKHGLQ